MQQSTSPGLMTNLHGVRKIGGRHVTLYSKVVRNQNPVPVLAAQCSGSRPFLSGSVVSAPYSSKCVTITSLFTSSSEPVLMAPCSGVNPELS